MLASGIQQNDSVIHIYILFHILFHYGLLQDTEYSSLCYTVGPCCLSQLFLQTKMAPAVIKSSSPILADFRNNWFGSMKAVSITSFT